MFLMNELMDEKYRGYVDYLNNNYDYCYLDSMHYIISQQDIRAIITGLSYGLTGVEAQKMDSTINLCMHSQDLYYDYLHAKYAVLNGKGKIRNCFITMGYYSLFYDLSLSRNKSRCSIYGMLFNDWHHEEQPIDYSMDLQDENCQCFVHGFFEEDISYYGTALTREMISEFHLTYKKSWQEIAKETRNEFAFDIAAKHNKHISRKETFKENVAIIENYMKFLAQRDIRPIVLVMPFSEEYRNYILKEYKEILLRILDVMPYRIDFLDMNDLDEFGLEDYLDAAHLNRNGAIKATNIINEIF